MSPARAGTSAPRRPLPAEETGLRARALTDFAAALASASPSPGGGCAAALPAALAAGLVAMVARLSAESDPFSDLAYDLEEVAAEADELRPELLRLLDEDVSAFDRVIAARRRRGTTPGQRAGRAQEIQSAYAAAVDPPCRVCQDALRVLELAGEVALRGHPHAASDAGVAVVLAAASVEAAALNVRTALGALDDTALRAERKQEVRAIEARAGRLRKSALAAVAAATDA